jgi:hypothetical protein
MKTIELNTENKGLIMVTLTATEALALAKVELVEVKTRIKRLTETVKKERATAKTVKDAERENKKRARLAALDALVERAFAKAIEKREKAAAARLKAMSPKAKKRAAKKASAPVVIQKVA